MKKLLTIAALAAFTVATYAASFAPPQQSGSFPSNAVVRTLIYGSNWQTGAIKINPVNGVTLTTVLLGTNAAATTNLWAKVELSGNGADYITAGSMNGSPFWVYFTPNGVTKATVSTNISASVLGANQWLKMTLTNQDLFTISVSNITFNAP